LGVWIVVFAALTNVAGVLARRPRRPARPQTEPAGCFLADWSYATDDAMAAISSTWHLILALGVIGSKAYQQQAGSLAGQRADDAAGAYTLLTKDCGNTRPRTIAKVTEAIIDCTAAASGLRR